MEQSPRTYAGMGEEDRRRVILDALNTHHHGTATAEAFNFGGKTDIRIAHDGRKAASRCCSTFLTSSSVSALISAGLSSGYWMTSCSSPSETFACRISDRARPVKRCVRPSR